MRKTKLRYKGMPVNILGLPSLDYVKKKSKTKKQQYLKSFSSNFRENSLKNLILMYDIPEGKKRERDWFRRQLKILGFVMIQRSVWVGPSPLPKDFVSYLKRIKLKKEFKTFKLSKSYKI